MYKETVLLNQVKIKKPRKLPSYYDKLKEDIKEYGIVNTITVNRNYEIIDGRLRYLIAKELGYKDIEVIIYENRK